MFRAIKMYNPDLGGHTLETVLGIIGAFFLLLGMVSHRMRFYDIY